MTSYTCILFDLPTQRDAVENALRDEAQQSIITTAKGRFWCYFMELNMWLPVTATVRVDPVTLAIMGQGATIKNTITTEMSRYFGAKLTMYKCYGQSPDGDSIGDDELVNIIQWVFVRKTDNDGGTAQPNIIEPASPPVDMSEIETWVQYGDEWKKVMMVNLEGPTDGRLFVNVSRLKRKALQEFGFDASDEIHLRAADMYDNDGGEMVPLQLKLNERIVHGRWYTLVVDKAMCDFDTEVN